jgi:hypothetical protein
MATEFLTVLAQALPAGTVPSNVANAVVAISVLAGGGVLGVSSVFVIKAKFRQWYPIHKWFSDFAAWTEKALPLGLGLFAGIFDLWKLSTLRGASDQLTLTLYGIAGFAAAWLVGLPWLITTSKEQEKAQIQTLQDQIRLTTAQRDGILGFLAALRGALEAKRARLLSSKNEGGFKVARLTDALSPKVQIHNFVKAAHQHFARHLEAGNQLRVGIYMRSPEDPNTLVALYSWDGTRENCFSNKHPEMMGLDAAGGAQSLV